jgi:hypothetical protein
MSTAMPSDAPGAVAAQTRHAPSADTRLAPSTTVLALVTVWRLAFAGVAWWAIYTGMTPNGSWRWTNLYSWSQVSTLAVALTATGSLLWPVLVRGALEPRRGLLRGASTTYTVGTLILFPLLLGGDYESRASLLMHLVVPLLAIGDWLFVGRNQGRLRWWAPVAWLVVPLLYLPAYMYRSGVARPPYTFLDPAKGDFVTWVFVLVGAFLALGLVVWAVGRARGALLTAAAR